jgi:hypothetical protein
MAPNTYTVRTLNVPKSQIKKALGVAATLIRTGWTKFTKARTREGLPVAVNSRDAACFCAMGAIERACGDDAVLWTATERALKEFAGITRPVSYWNDAPGRTKEDVIQAFETAYNAVTVE